MTSKSPAHGLNDDVIRTLQASIDHPSFDSETISSHGTHPEDVAECLAIFSALPSADRDSDDQLSSSPTSVPVQETKDVKRGALLAELDPGRFDVFGVLGVGGFGVVLGVIERSKNQQLALKILRPSLSSSGRLSRRFLREIEIATRLRHEGIVSVLETGTIRGRPCILSTQIDGPSLSELLARQEGPLDIPVAVDVIRQVAEALQYAHERGVLHRDLKPGNILLQIESGNDTKSGDAGYRPKLTDFGLAKQFDDVSSADQSLSARSELLGTPRYMSPEQAAGRLGDVGIGSDIYSLGAILYRCIAGRPACTGETAKEILAKIQAGNVQKPSLFNQAISPDLENVTLKCLALEPHDRYRTATELAADLLRFQKGEPVSARRAGVVRRLRHWCLHHPGVALLSFGLLASAVLSVILSWRLYLSSKSEAQANERMLQIAFQAVNDAYVEVAEKMLNSVPNSLDEQYKLHQRALDAHKKIAEEFQHNALSRYRLSVQYSYLGRSAARLGRFNEAIQHHEECLKLLMALSQADPENQDYRYDMFFNRKCLADMMHPFDAGKEQALEDVLQEIIALCEIAGDDPDYLDARAASLFALGEFLNTQSSDQAIPYLNASIQISEELMDAYPSKPLYGKYAILARAELAISQLRLGGPDLALKTCQEAERLHAWLSGQFEEPVIANSLLRSLHYSELRAYVDLKDWTKAVAAANTAIETEAKTEAHVPHAYAYEDRRCQILLLLLTAKRNLGAPEPECQEIIAKIQKSIERWEAKPDANNEIAAVRIRLKELEL